MSSPDSLLILPLPELFGDDVFRIESRRLWLRWLAPGDALRVHEIAAGETAARGAGAAPHPLLAGEPLARIAAARAVNAAGSGLVLALSSKARPGDVIGLIGLEVTRRGALSLCFVLDVRHQGNGLMTEAVRALAQAVFSFAPHRAICGPAALTNHAARRVLEKSGFRTAGNAVAAAAGQRLQLTRSVWLGRSTGLDETDGGGTSADAPCACAA